MSQPLTGDGEIVARVTAVQQIRDNRAGVMIRESMAPEAKYVSLVARPSGSRSLLEGVDFKLKAVAGAKPTTAGRHGSALSRVVETDPRRKRLQGVRLTRGGDVDDGGLRDGRDEPAGLHRHERRRRS